MKYIAAFIIYFLAAGPSYACSPPSTGTYGDFWSLRSAECGPAVVGGKQFATVATYVVHYDVPLGKGVWGETKIRRGVIASTDPNWTFCGFQIFENSENLNGMAQFSKATENKLDVYLRVFEARTGSSWVEGKIRFRFVPTAELLASGATCESDGYRMRKMVLADGVFSYRRTKD